MRTFEKILGDKTSSSSSENPQPSCRICLDNSNQEDLFTPCQCKGTIKYVHKSCLESYYQHLIRKNRLSANKLRCEICLTKYRFDSEYFWKFCMKHIELVNLTLFVFLICFLGFVALRVNILQPVAPLRGIHLQQLYHQHSHVNDNNPQQQQQQQQQQQEKVGRMYRGFYRGIVENYNTNIDQDSSSSSSYQQQQKEESSKAYSNQQQKEESSKAYSNQQQKEESSKAYSNQQQNEVRHPPDSDGILTHIQFIPSTYSSSPPQNNNNQNKNKRHNSPYTTLRIHFWNTPLGVLITEIKLQFKMSLCLLINGSILFITLLNGVPQKFKRQFYIPILASIILTGQINPYPLFNYLTMSIDSVVQFIVKLTAYLTMYIIYFFIGYQVPVVTFYYNKYLKKVFKYHMNENHHGESISSSSSSSSILTSVNDNLFFDGGGSDTTTTTTTTATTSNHSFSENQQDQQWLKFSESELFVLFFKLVLKTLITMLKFSHILILIWSLSLSFEKIQKFTAALVDKVPLGIMQYDENSVFYDDDDQGSEVDSFDGDDSDFMNGVVGINNSITL